MNKPYIFDAITNTLTATATFLRKASISLQVTKW